MMDEEYFRSDTEIIAELKKFCTMRIGDFTIVGTFVSLGFGPVAHSGKGGGRGWAHLAGTAGQEPRTVRKGIGQQAREGSKIFASGSGTPRP